MEIAEYAQRRGVHPQTIINAILAGRILRNADGTIDTESADQQWDETTRPKMLTGPLGPRQQSSGATEPVPGMLYADARALQAVFDAQRRKLELQVRAGKLVNREEAERAAFLRFRQLRDACMEIPTRLAPLITGEKEEAKVFHALEDEIRRVFEHFASGDMK